MSVNIDWLSPVPLRRVPPQKKVVTKISEDSVILLGGDGRDWGMNSTEYADHMARSR